MPDGYCCIQDCMSMYTDWCCTDKKEVYCLKPKCYQYYYRC